MQGSRGILSTRLNSTRSLWGKEAAPEGKRAGAEQRGGARGGAGGRWQRQRKKVCRPWGLSSKLNVLYHLGKFMLGPRSTQGPGQPESLVPSQKSESQVRTQSLRSTHEAHGQEGFSPAHSLTDKYLLRVYICQALL